MIRVMSTIVATGMNFGANLMYGALSRRLSMGYRSNSEPGFTGFAVVQSMHIVGWPLMPFWGVDRHMPDVFGIFASKPSEKSGKSVVSYIHGSCHS